MNRLIDPVLNFCQRLNFNLDKDQWVMVFAALLVVGFLFLKGVNGSGR